MEKDSIAKGMSSLGCGTAEDMDISMMTKFCMGLASASQRTRKEEEGNTEVRRGGGRCAHGIWLVGSILVGLEAYSSGRM